MYTMKHEILFTYFKLHSLDIYVYTTLNKSGKEEQ